MKFDVFLSFRGTDTRKNFVSHLYHSLFKERVRTFKDDEDLLGHQPASPQALQAIEESRVAVVVISVKYTCSNSCLDELMKILECKETQSLVVVPVLYEVDPSDFEQQAKDLADKLGKHAERDNLDKVKRRYTMENVTRWKAALIELTRTFQNYASGVEEDSDMIDKIMNYISPHLSEPTGRVSKTAMESSRVRAPMKSIAKVIQNCRSAFTFKFYMRRDMGYTDKPIGSVKPKPRRKLRFMSEQKYVTGNELSQLVPSSDFNSLVGMDRHMNSLYTLLELGLRDGVHEIGMWGEAGVGKTTLSKYVYGQISPKFQDHYYHNYQDDTTKSSLNGSSTCLLEEITRAVVTPISSSLLTRYCDVVKAKLGHRKVLLIVDGVDHMDQRLNYIRKIACWFGPGSRLIFVTQDKSLLLDHGIRHLYEVESLKYDEALQLFSQFAFKQNNITRGFDRLCVRAVLVSGRLPLALKVFGSFLRGKTIKEWEFELLKLEASQANCTTVVSSYIGGDFYGRRPTKLDRYIVGKDDEGDEIPSYWLA